MASFVYFSFFEDGERVFWPLFRGIMANIWDYVWLFRPFGMGGLVLQHQFFVTTIPYEGLIISEFYSS